MDLGMENGGKLMERMDLHVENTTRVWFIGDGCWIHNQGQKKLRKSDSFFLPRHDDSYGYILIQRVLSESLELICCFSRGIFEPQQLQISRFLVATCLGINPKKMSQ